MGHIIDSTYIYGTFFAVIPYESNPHDYLPQRWFGYNPRIIELRATTKQSTCAQSAQYLYVLLCRSIPNMVLLYLVYYGFANSIPRLRGSNRVHVPFEKVPALRSRCRL